MIAKVNYTPKIGDDIFTINVDSQNVEVVILESFSNGYVVIEALNGEPFMRGSIWGAYPCVQTVVPRSLLSYSYAYGESQRKTKAEKEE